VEKIIPLRMKQMDSAAFGEAYKLINLIMLVSNVSISFIFDDKVSII
jgi:hypothetical protein